MEIFCTKKLAALLRTPLQEEEKPAPAFHRWCATTVTVRRRRMVLLTHEPTLFTVVLWGVRRLDLDRFVPVVWQAVRDALANYGAKESILQQFLPVNEDVILRAARLENRATQSAMNRAVRYLQPVWDQECTPGLLQWPAVVRLNESSALSDRYGLTPMDSLEALLRDMSGQAPFAQKYMRLRASLSLGEHTAAREFYTPHNYTFHQLYQVLQRVFQWHGANGYLFAVPNDLNVCYVLPPEAGEPDDPRGPVARTRTAVLGQFLRPEQKFAYACGPQVPWDVELEVLGIQDCVPTWGVICTDSRGVSPPDDVQSAEEFLDCLDAARRPAHPRHQEASARLNQRCPTAEEINRWL